MVTRKNNYWVDENENVWHVMDNTEAEAEAKSKTMVNCRECWDSERCTDCIDCECCFDCWSCERCNNCRDSSDLYRCDGCVSCKECSDCNNCHNCSNCKKCIDCWSCEHCTDCKGCTFQRDVENVIVTERDQVIKLIKQAAYYMKDLPDTGDWKEQVEALVGKL